MRRPLVLLLPLALSACLALGLAAQETASRTGGSVRGVVYDSLLRQPLAGVMVWIDDTTQTITDTRGRFLFSDVPAGERRLRFDNPELDTVGFPRMTRQITVASRRETHADLGVPSLATLYRHLCSRRLPTASHDAPLASILVGTILDAATGRRVALARVQASWLSVETDAPPFFERQTLETRSDSLGGYVLCGLPVGTGISLIAAGGPDLTGVVDVPVTRRNFAVQNLYVSLDSSTTDSATGLRLGHAVIVGQARTEYGPVPDVEVGVDGAAAAWRTGPDGGFRLDRLPAGTQVVMARAVGYGALRQVVHLRGGDTVRLTLTLHRLTTLDTIRIIGHRNPDVVALMSRLEQGFGYIMTGDRLLSAEDVPALLATVPGLAVAGPPGVGCTQGTRNDEHCFRIVRAHNAAAFSSPRDCRARIWVDGHPSSELQLAMIQPRDLIAVEWFPDLATLPQRYATANDCAILLVWTRALR